MTDALNRRDFLKLGSGAVAAAALGTAAATAAEPAKKRKIHKALMYGTLTYKGSVLEQFKALKAAGFEGVEPMSHMNQDEVLKALETSGLKAASVCCATHWRKRLSDPDEKVRQEAREGVQRALMDAKRYGATSILLVPGQVIQGKVTYDECFKRSVAEIKRLVPVAKETGVKMAIENVWNDFITKPEQAKEFLAEGDKVKVEIILRGREKRFGDLAGQVIQQFIALLNKDVPLKVEQPVLRQGGQLTSIVGKA